MHSYSARSQATCLTNRPLIFYFSGVFGCAGIFETICAAERVEEPARQEMLPLFSRPRAPVASRKVPDKSGLSASEWLEPGQGWALAKKTLCEASELPEWYEGYPYVRKLYRVNYTTCDCARSLVEMHNETCNIWSHLVGCGIFLFQSARSCRTLFESGLDGNEVSRLTFTVCASVMLGSSATYHTFYPLSRRVLHALLTADKLGIALMLGGSYVPGVWLGFRAAAPFVRIAWLADAALITVIASRLAWRRSMKRFKVVVVGLIISSLAPSLHWVRGIGC